MFFRRFCCGTGGRSVILNIEEDRGLFAQQAKRLVRDLNKRSKQMRDKHISAMPASGRQRGSETTTFTGHQGFYSTRLIYQNLYRRNRLLTVLLAMSLFFIILPEVYALNQIENGDFTSSETAGWTQSTKEFYDAGKTSLNFSSDNNSASYLSTNSLKLTLTILNGGSPNLLYYGKVNLSQSILTSQRSTQVNAGPPRLTKNTCLM